MLKSSFHVLHKSPAVTGGFHGRWASNHLRRKTPKSSLLGRKPAGNDCRSSESFMHSTSFQCPEVSEIKGQQGSLCLCSCNPNFSCDFLEILSVFCFFVPSSNFKIFEVHHEGRIVLKPCELCIYFTEVLLLLTHWSRLIWL